MSFHSDIGRSICAYLTLEDIPSLRACKLFNSLKRGLIEQQAEQFGWNKGEKDPLDFLKELFNSIRLCAPCSFVKKEPKAMQDHVVYILKVYKTLIYLKTISFNELIIVLNEIKNKEGSFQHVILNVIGLSALNMMPPLPQEVKNRALMHVAKIAHAPLCEKILQHGANPNFILQRTSFHEVILKGNAALARVFLNFNADPSLTTIGYESSLQLAVESGSMETLEVVLETGVKDTPTPAGTAFSKALSSGQIQMAKRLKAQAQKLCRDSSFNSYLHLAMMNPDEEWMLEDFDPTAQINTFNLAKMTPLHAAVNNQNDKGVRYLLDKGANPHIKGLLGKTPLELAPKNIKPLFEKTSKRKHVDER